MQRVRSQLGLRAALAALAVTLAGGVLSACSAGRGERDLVAGKQMFVEKCGSCHVLGRAGTKGVTGPNLDMAFEQGLRDGMERSGIEGAVYGQIVHPSTYEAGKRADGSPEMPADLVTGEDARDVAAYVAASVAKGGKDTGLLATAVKAAGGGEPAVASNGTLSIPADPGGQLAYTTNQATADAGPLKVESPNESGTPHNIVIDGKGEGQVVQDGGVSEFSADFAAGEYAFYCSVPGHREAGMEGKLTVK